jgi:hypothetical protein
MAAKGCGFLGGGSIERASRASHSGDSAPDAQIIYLPLANQHLLPGRGLTEAAAELHPALAAAQLAAWRGMTQWQSMQRCSISSFIFSALTFTP